MAKTENIDVSLMMSGNDMQLTSSFNLILSLFTHFWKGKI